MRNTKHTVGIIVTLALMMGVLGISAMASTESTMSKRAAESFWSSADKDHPIILWQITDKNSASRIHVSVNDHDPALGGPRSNITLSGCSGQNLTIKSGSNIECVVNSSAPLVATSVDNQEAVGTVEFLAVAPTFSATGQ